MKVIYDIDAHEKYIRSALKKYTTSVEHNYDYWKYCSRSDRPNVFFDFGNKKGILTRLHARSKNWYILGNPLGPKEEWFSMLLGLLNHIFYKEDASKVYIEIEDEFRQDVINRLKRTKFRDSKLNTYLIWPMFDMKKWDASLKGKGWKKIRNILNRFKKSHRVKVVDCRKIPKEKLYAVVDQWNQDRKGKDSVDAYYYKSIIDGNFKGMDVCRSVVVDGEPRSITCGWYIPKLKTYYSAVGIYDYEIAGLGEYCNIDDLLYVRRKRYRYVDFGGSDEYLLDFKKKFKHHWTYNTYLFSIVRKDKKFPKRKRRVVKNSLTFKTVSSMKKCRELWEQFSEHEVMGDIWEYREPYHHYDKQKLRFIVGYKGDEAVGILPMVYEPGYELTYFGGHYSEDNKFMMSDKSYAREFLKKCPWGTTIYYLSQSEMQYADLTLGDKQYVLDMSKYDNDIEKYFQSFSKKHRKNIRYDLKQIEKLNPIVHFNRIEDYDIMVQFNKDRFGTKSDYKDKTYVEQVRKLLNVAKDRGELRMFSIEIDGKIVSVQLAIAYKEWYYFLNGGRDLSIQNLGKYTNALHIKHALKEGISKINFLTTDTGWKDLWNLDTIYTYDYVKE